MKTSAEKSANLHKRGRKRHQRSIAGFRVGERITLFEKPWRLEKVRRVYAGEDINIKPGSKIVIIRRLNKDGEHVNKHSKPVIIEKREFIKQLNIPSEKSKSTRSKKRAA